MGIYINFIKKFRKPLLVMLVLINIIAIVGITRIRISTDFNIFTAKDSVYQDNLLEMEKYFDSSEQLMILIETDKIDTNAVKEWSSFQTFVQDLENVSFVNGPAPQKISIGQNVIDTQNITESEVENLKNYYSKFDTFSPIVDKEETTYGTFVIFTNDNFDRDDIKTIENYLENENIKYYVSGNIYNQLKIVDYVMTILMFLPPCALLLILSVFKTQMKSFKATILSVVPAGLGALWTMGLIGWLGNEVSIITVIAPVFTIVIGSADGLHFISHIQDTRKEGLNKIDSIIETLKMVGIPMIITTVTSVAGFLSLLVMNTESIYDFAIFTSVGITFAGIATWYVLPLILVGKVELKYSESDKNIFDIGYKGIRKLWGKASIIILSLLLIISIISLNFINNEFNMLMVYKDYTDVSKNYNKIMDVSGGSTPMYAFIKLENDPLDISSSNKVNSLIKELKSSEYVQKVNSIYDYFAIFNSILQNRPEPEYPNDVQIVEKMYSMISSNKGTPIGELINRKEKVIRLMIFPKDLENDTLNNIENIIDDFNAKYNLDDAKVTGLQFLMKDLSDDMLVNQVKSISLAIFLVFVLLLISLRNLKVTIFSLLPIISTVVIIFGFLGLSGIPLNIITTIIFSISIGVGIDYAVHYSSVWMTYYKRNNNKLESAEKAYKYTSRPILANAIGLAIGLSVLLFSPLKIHFYVSVLMWVAMLVSVFLTLSFLPTLLITRTKNR